MIENPIGKKGWTIGNLGNELKAEHFCEYATE